MLPFETLLALAVAAVLISVAVVFAVLPAVLAASAAVSAAVALVLNIVTMRSLIAKPIFLKRPKETKFNIFPRPPKALANMATPATPPIIVPRYPSVISSKAVKASINVSRTDPIVSRAGPNLAANSAASIFNFCNIGVTDLRASSYLF